MCCSCEAPEKKCGSCGLNSVQVGKKLQLAFWVQNTSLPSAVFSKIADQGILIPQSWSIWILHTLKKSSIPRSTSKHKLVVNRYAVEMQYVFDAYALTIDMKVSC